MSLFGSLLGGSKSSQSTSTSTLSTGAQTQAGNPISVAFNSKGKKSKNNLTINTETTDFGAVEAGINVARAATNRAARVAERAISSSEDTLDSVVLAFSESQSDTLGSSERLVAANNEALAAVVTGASLNEIRSGKTVENVVSTLKWPLMIAVGVFGIGVFKGLES